MMAKRKKARKVRSLRGVEVHVTETGEEVVYIRFQADGKAHRERVGPSVLDEFKKNVTVIEARALLKVRRAEIREARLRGERWLSPAEREAEAARAEAEARAESEHAEQSRRDLLFEVASERFLAACGADYARPDEIRGLFRRLGLAFNGRHLDTLTRRDVLQYREDRLANTGPYAEWPRKVGLRVPQMELTALSALYSYLIADEEREIANPCHRPRSFSRRRTKALTYRPVRRPVIPTREELQGLFDAAATPAMRALLMVTYYTAARPESETLRLRHGDVEFAGSNVRSLNGSEPLGRVTYRNTKTAEDREVPLHPLAAEALAAIMEPRPETVEALKAWRELPIFRQANGEPWARWCYRKAWLATLRAACEVHPGLEGIIVRDLRKAANTAMRSAGTDAATAARILGHSAEMNYRYVEATDNAAQRAILAL